MTKQQGDNTIKTVSVILSMVLAAGGVLFAIGAQNQKIETMGCEQTVLRGVVADHEKSITTLETKMDYIVKGVDEIRTEIKK